MSRFIDLDNPSGLPVRPALVGLLKRGLSRDYAVIPVYAPDDVGGRRERTAGGGPAEVEIYADGSGFEIAWRGRVFMLGVERAESREPRGFLASLYYFTRFLFGRRLSSVVAFEGE